MAVTSKRLASGALSDSNATLYTAPASTSAVIKSLTVCNTSGSAVTVTLKLDGVELYAGFSLAANTSIIIPSIDQIIETGELIEGSASTASVIKYMISGKEITA